MPTVALGLAHTIWYNSMSTTVAVSISFSLINVGITLAKMLQFDSHATNNETLAFKLDKLYLAKSNTNPELELTTNSKMGIGSNSNSANSNDINNVNYPQNVTEIEYHRVSSKYNIGIKRKIKNKVTKCCLQIVHHFTILQAFLIFIASDCYLRIFPSLMLYIYLLHTFNNVAYVFLFLGMLFFIIVDYFTLNKMIDSSNNTTNVKFYDKILFASTCLASNLLFVIFICELDFLSTIQIADIKPFFQEQMLRILMSFVFQLVIITWYNVDDSINVYFGIVDLYVVYWIVLAIHVICLTYMSALFLNKNKDLTDCQYLCQQCTRRIKFWK